MINVPEVCRGTTTEFNIEVEYRYAVQNINKLQPFIRTDVINRITDYKIMPGVRFRITETMQLSPLHTQKVCELVMKHPAHGTKRIEVTSVYPDKDNWEKTLNAAIAEFGDQGPYKKVSKTRLELTMELYGCHIDIEDNDMYIESPTPISSPSEYGLGPEILNTPR